MYEKRVPFKTGSLRLLMQYVTIRELENETDRLHPSAGLVERRVPQLGDDAVGEFSSATARFARSQCLRRTTSCSVSLPS